MYCNKENVNILTSLLVKHKVKHVVVCPGSRNAPLVHNFNECPDIICHPATDERSAGFIALGLSHHSESPVAVCVTSGSALLNVLPGAAEASYQHHGIIVISADRPPQWIGQLDGQTMPQQGALGSFTGKSVTLPEIHTDEDRWYCNRLVNEALLSLASPSHASVHINVPLSEPLFEFSVKELPDERAVTLTEWAKASQLFLAARRPMIVIGQRDNSTPSPLPFVVLSEQLSCNHKTFTDQMLYVIQQSPSDYQPDCVLYIGGNTISKRLRQFLRALPQETLQMVVSENGELHDVSQQTDILITDNAQCILSSLSNTEVSLSVSQKSFYAKWETLRQVVEQKHDDFQPPYSQMLAVKRFEESIPSSSIVYYANSMSLRLGAVYADHYCYCNRGLNGIEGSLSVAAGASLATTEDVFCVIGDLSFFYDQNALWQQELSGNLRILLLNNGQGGIFRNLKGLNQSPVCDTLISARHETTAEGICKQYRIDYMQANDEKTLSEGIKKLLTQRGERPVLLEVMTNIDDDERIFKEYFHTLK